jgi:hypothetical protein
MKLILHLIICITMAMMIASELTAKNIPLSISLIILFAIYIYFAINLIKR